MPAPIALDTTTGEFAGYGSVFGVEDLGGDTVLAGAFADTLPAFRSAGVICWGHDTSRPVAIPIEAREDHLGLYLRGRFHSTADGQDARRITAERQAAGLTFGLSIGYLIVKSGPAPDGGRMLYKLWLLEVSLVAIPMNPFATVQSVKAEPRSVRASGQRDDLKRIAQDNIAALVRLNGVAV